jgi:hypothetical protein
VKTYIEEFLTTFSGFHQTDFSFLTSYSLQQLFTHQLFSQPHPNQTDPYSRERRRLRVRAGWVERVREWSEWVNDKENRIRERVYQFNNMFGLTGIPGRWAHIFFKNKYDFLTRKIFLSFWDPLLLNIIFSDF